MILLRTICLQFHQRPLFISQRTVSTKPKLLERPLVDQSIKLTPRQLQAGSIRTGALAFKSGMMSHFDEWGQRHPCTVLNFSDCQVIGSFKINDALIQEVGVGQKSLKTLHSAQRIKYGRLGLTPKLRLRGFQITPDSLMPPGTPIPSSHFLPGQYVDVQAVSIGKGFQGGMKRWGFKGLPASHGVSVSHRALGATGCRTDPGKVDKGKKMPGHMGNRNVTVQRLLVLKVDPILNCLYLRGSVPGHDNTVVRIFDTKRPRPGEWASLLKQLPHPTCLEKIPPPKSLSEPREIQMPKTPKDPLHYNLAAE